MQSINWKSRSVPDCLPWFATNMIIRLSKTIKYISISHSTNQAINETDLTTYCQRPQPIQCSTVRGILALRCSAVRIGILAEI